jgi:hypothetical protein
MLKVHSAIVSPINSTQKHGTSMQSILIHFASLAVMVHLSLGCQWHHGLGESDSCQTGNHQAHQRQCSDDHHHGHGHPGHRSFPLAQQAVEPGADMELAQGPIPHDRCQNDGCSATPASDYRPSRTKPIGLYLANAEDDSVGQQPSATGKLSYRARYQFSAAPLRAHLLLGVLLI